MQNLNHAQLELEGLKIEAISLPMFAPIVHLPDYLKKMEGYLRKILGEYEKMLPSLDSGQSICFSQFEYLDEFTTGTEQCFEFKDKSDSPHRFKSGFSKPYAHIIKLISQHFI